MAVQEVVFSREELVAKFSINQNARWLKFEVQELRLRFKDILDDVVILEDGRRSILSDSIENIEEVIADMIGIDLSLENQLDIFESVEVIIKDGHPVVRE